METRACEEMNEGHLPFFGAPFDSLFNNLSRNPISLIGGLKKKELQIGPRASCNGAKLAHALGVE